MEAQANREKRHAAIFHATKDLHRAIIVLKDLRDELIGEQPIEVEKVEVAREEIPCAREVYAETPGYMQREADEILGLVADIRDIVL